MLALWRATVRQMAEPGDRQHTDPFKERKGTERNARGTTRGFSLIKIKPFLRKRTLQQCGVVVKASA